MFLVCSGQLSKEGQKVNQQQSHAHAGVNVVADRCKCGQDVNSSVMTSLLGVVPQKRTSVLVRHYFSAWC